MKYIFFIVQVFLIGFEEKYIKEQFAKSLLIPGSFTRCPLEYVSRVDILNNTIGMLHAHALHDLSIDQTQALAWYQELRTKQIIISSITSEFMSQKTVKSMNYAKFDELLKSEKMFSERTAIIQHIIKNLKKQDEQSLKTLSTKNRDAYFQFLVVAIMEESGCQEYKDIYKQRTQKIVNKLPCAILNIPTIKKYKESGKIAYDVSQIKGKTFSWSSSESD